MMKRYVIIVAGGTGKRMGTDIPKQFLELNGKPVLMHTIERFIDFDEAIKVIVVLPEDHMHRWDLLIKKHSFSVNHVTATGGKKRFFSVRNGLKHVGAPGLVAIHDAVRPFVSRETIGRCFDVAERKGNALPAVSPEDSLRIMTGSGSRAVNRERIKQVQTPQVFNAELITKAYMQAYDPGFTDDATVLEKSGEEINIVEGNRENIKITFAEDMVIAHALLSLIS